MGGGRHMGKWPLWIGTTLLAVTAVQLVMIFVLPSLPIGVASESARASNEPGADLPTALPTASSNTAATATADTTPLYSACVHETSKPPLRVAATGRHVDILFVFSGTAQPERLSDGNGHIVMRAPTQFNVVMFRRLAPHDPAAEGNDGAARSADCAPF